MIKTANELWFDALVRHQVYLMRVSGSIRNDINGLLNATEKAMTDHIHAALAGSTKLSPARLRKAEALIEQLKQIRSEVWIEADGLWKETMKGLTTQEVQQVNQMLKSVSPAELSTQLPSVAKLQALVATHPFEGSVLGSWSKKIAKDDIERIAQQVRIGVVQGETTRTIARRIIGSAKLKGADGVTQITRRHAESITQTAVGSYSNASRDMFFNENSDLFTKEIYTATLDGRTTPVCRGYDGQRFKIGEGPHPPLHFRCRSLRVAEINGEAIGSRPATPVTRKMLLKRYAEQNKLGKIASRDRLPRGHKGKYDKFQRTEMRKMVGRVPAKLTYNDWLKGQSVDFQNDVLGPTRAKLFRTGKMPLSRFVDKTGKTIRLDQLAVTEAKAFKAAGLGVEVPSIPAPPATSLLDQRLAKPEVQALIESYNAPHGLNTKIIQRKIRGKLALKGVFIDETGALTTETTNLAPRNTFPKLKPTGVAKTPTATTSYAEKYQAWTGGLEADETLAFRYWSRDVYAVGDMRNFQAGRMSGLSAEVKHHGAMFNQAIKRAPKYQGTVYRGQGFDAGAKTLKVGKNFKFEGVSSASKNFDVAEEFASYAPTDDIVLFEVRTKSGVDIERLLQQEYWHQEEVLLTKNINYRIVAKEFIKDSMMDNPAGGYWRVILDEI